MLLYFIATFCIALASGYSVRDDAWVGDDDSEELRWPETYTVKATRLSLTANLVENVEVWANNQSSRIDYNDGSVVTITTVAESEDGYRYEVYQVYPKTTDGENAESVCDAFSNEISELVSLTTVLPAITEDDDFEAVGNETVNDRETVRFESIVSSKEKDVRRTIWAEYATYDGESIWIPVRYEEKKYNTHLGGLTTHDIWDFSEFDVYFESEVFDAEGYGCEKPEAVRHAADSDKVLRELMFMNPENPAHVDHVFNKFRVNFEREYAHEREHAMRKAIFHENMKMVAAVNRQNLGYKLAINSFSDRTPAELEKTRGLKRRSPGTSGNIAFPYDADKIKEIADDLPEEYDLRMYNLVGPVLDQQDCGSCWTFGTTAAVEGALARINGGRLLRLANQALVDCVWPYGANGCEGGTDNAAYDWMMDFGLPTEEEYGSYRNKNDFCHIANMTKIYPIRGWTDVTPFSDEATKVAVVNHGPLSVSVHVTEQFSHYSSGIFYQSNCNPNRLNHEVTMVGYGVRDGELFWILKNSWGPNWGIDGYMLIAAKDNTCGPTTEPTYVVF